VGDDAAVDSIELSPDGEPLAAPGVGTRGGDHVDRLSRSLLDFVRVAGGGGLAAVDARVVAVAAAVAPGAAYPPRDARATPPRQCPDGHRR
jgi:hypothetical protein